jgi:hypothetical protein
VAQYRSVVLLRRPFTLSPMTIHQINQTPMSRLRFRDFQRLKSGRDTFSRVKLDELVGMVPLEDLREIETEFEFDEFGHYARHRASCLRWLLRGLTVDRAIRKVKTDLEIMDNAIHKYVA